MTVAPHMTDTEERDQIEDRLEWILRRDMRAAAATLDPGEVRYLVDLYYQFQHWRVASTNAVRAGQDNDEPNDLIGWFAGRIAKLERTIPGAMKVYCNGRRDGRWALSIHGIGPVLTAGLLSHFDIEKAPTVGHFWSFAGLDPEQEWKKGEKRPFNARLKVLCWKIGQSFMKLRGNDKDIYGKVYEDRKRYEIDRNLAGEHKGYQLRTASGTKTVDELPPFIIDARARRYAVKLFLAHLHHVMYVVRFNADPPKPYVMSHLGHAHFIAPPNWPSE